MSVNKRVGFNQTYDGYGTNNFEMQETSDLSDATQGNSWQFNHGNEPVPDYVHEASVRVDVEERPYVSSDDDDSHHGYVNSTEIDGHLPSRRISELAHHTLSRVRRRKSSAGALKTQQSRIRRPTHVYQTWRDNPQAMEQEILNTMEEDDILVGGDEEQALVRHTEELRGMTIALSRKRIIREKLERKKSRQDTGQRGKGISSWRHMKYGCSIRMEHAKLAISSYLRAVGFWEGHLKKIASNFGTDVTAYFLFMRWLFLANLIGFLIILFVFIPQVLWTFVYKGNEEPDHDAERGAWIITGTGEDNYTSGFFERTGMYYGHYSHNATSTTTFPYSIPKAYFYTYAAYFLIFFVVIAISAAKSYRKNFIESSGKFTFQYVLKILDGWDYGIDAEESSKQKKNNIFYDLREFCASRNLVRRQESCCDMMMIYIFRFAAVVIQLSLIAVSTYGVIAISLALVGKKYDLPEVIRDIAVPLFVSGINISLPFVFTWIALYQKFRNPRSVVYSSLIMTMLLYVAMLLGFFGITMIPCRSALLNDTATPKQLTELPCPECWETKLGEQVYSLIIVDFFLFVLVTLTSEVFYRICTSYCCKQLSHPQFDIARNTMNLIYNQFLCWLGVYYSPLLIVVVGVKLFLTFYLKRVTVMQSCIPTKKPWRAAKMHTIFLVLLFFGFLVCAIVFGVALAITQPSKTCGPFQKYPTVLEMVTKGVEQNENVVLEIFLSPGIVVGIIIVLSVCVHYVRVVSSGKKELIRLLQLQITMESRDKVYLRNMLDRVQKHKDSQQQIKAQCNCPGDCGEMCEHSRQSQQPEDRLPELRPAPGRTKVFIKERSNASLLTNSSSNLAGSREDLTKHPDNIRSSTGTHNTTSTASGRTNSQTNSDDTPISERRPRPARRNVASVQPGTVSSTMPGDNAHKSGRNTYY